MGAVLGDSLMDLTGIAVDADGYVYVTDADNVLSSIDSDCIYRC